MNINETIDDLRALMAPLDPAAPDRLDAGRLLADVPSTRQVMARADAEAGAERTPSGLRRRPWTRRRLVRWAAPGVVIALAGGAVAAATALGNSPASVKNEVRCYSVRQLTDDSHQYTDTAQASAGTGAQAPPDESATVAAALDTCSALWQIGFIQPGKIVTDVAANPGRRTVPALAACVLADGEAAVFPGDSTTCAYLDLQALSDRK